MTSRLNVRGINATGYDGAGAKALHDDGTWKIPAGGSTSGSMPSAVFGALARTADTAVVAGSPQKVTFDTKDDDTGAVADLANSRFIAPYDGVYLLAARIAVSAAQTELIVYAYVNGAGVGSPSARHLARGPVTANFGLSGSIPLRLVAGDFVEVYVRASTATNLRGTVPSWARLAMLTGATDTIDGGSL